MYALRASPVNRQRLLPMALLSKGRATTCAAKARPVGRQRSLAAPLPAPRPLKGTSLSPRAFLAGVDQLSPRKQHPRVRIRLRRLQFPTTQLRWVFQAGSTAPQPASPRCQRLFLRYRYAAPQPPLPVHPPLLTARSAPTSSPSQLHQPQPLARPASRAQRSTRSRRVFPARARTWPGRLSISLSTPSRSSHQFWETLVRRLAMQAIARVAGRVRGG